MFIYKNVLKIWREVIIYFIYFVKIVNVFERYYYKELIYICMFVDGYRKKEVVKLNSICK